MFGYPSRQYSKPQMYGSQIPTPGAGLPSGYPQSDPSLILDFHANYNVVAIGGRVVSWTDRIRGLTVTPVSKAGPFPNYLINVFDDLNGVSMDPSFTTWLNVVAKIPELEDKPGITIITLLGGGKPGSYSVTDRGRINYQVFNDGNRTLGMLSTASTPSTLLYYGIVRNGLASQYVTTNQELGGQISIYTMSYDGSQIDANKFNLSINGGGRITGTPNVGPTRTFKSLAAEKCEFNIGGLSQGAGDTGVSGGGTYMRILVYNRTIKIDSNEHKSIINNIQNENRLFGKRQLICTGDSRTAGSAHPTTPGWCEALQQLEGTSAWIVQNAGVDSTTVVTQLADQSNKILTATGTYKRQVYIVWMGINDYQLNGDTDVTIYGNLKTYCANIKANNPNAVVGLNYEMPGDSIAGWEAVRQSINSMITAEASPTWDFTINASADANIGVAGANSNATYYISGGSQIHMTQTGDAYFALNYVLPAIAGY